MKSGVLQRDNMKKEPLVSVITAVFNGDAFIEKSILSVKNQDYRNIEHIIMDGGSKDKTLDILKKYEGTYNLKWFSQKDNGAVDAINNGFENASGDIFCWLDSDDYYLPGTINKIVDIFNNHKNIDVVFGDSFLVDSNDKIIGQSIRTNFDFDMFLYLGMNITPQSAFWRRTMHEKVGGLDRQYIICSDRDFFLRMYLAGAKFHHIKDFLSSYRLHQNQQTKNKKLMDIESRKIFETHAPKNLSPLTLKYKKTKILLKKAFLLLMQGNMLYAIKRALERLNIIKTKENEF